MITILVRREKTKELKRIHYRLYDCISYLDNIEELNAILLYAAQYIKETR